jgi:DNA-directed RNA polymerase subunit RPC12/RpoP
VGADYGQCARCGGAVTRASWVVKDGAIYHGDCFHATRDRPEDQDVLNAKRYASIVADLREQLRRSDAQRDELQRKLTAAECPDCGYQVGDPMVIDSMRAELVVAIRRADDAERERDLLKAAALEGDKSGGK